MLSKYRQKRDKGFTIIEVLIVLAIAGLIMLVVFLAIPALQRNSRNNQRTTDVANILGGIGEYVANNNGSLPDLTAGSDNTLVIGDAATENEIEIQLGYYTAANVDINSDADVTEESVNIVTGATCNGTQVATSDSTRSYVASYMLENDAEQCRAS